MAERGETITQLYTCSVCAPSDPNPDVDWCSVCAPERAKAKRNGRSFIPNEAVLHLTIRYNADKMSRTMFSDAVNETLGMFESDGDFIEADTASGRWTGDYDWEWEEYK